MKKSEAIALLGDSLSEAAKAIGISAQALSQWPDELPSRLLDRVQAALWRRQASIAQPSEGQGKESAHG